MADKKKLIYLLASLTIIFAFIAIKPFTRNTPDYKNFLSTLEIEKLSESEVLTKMVRKLKTNIGKNNAELTPWRNLAWTLEAHFLFEEAVRVWEYWNNTYEANPLAWSSISRLQERMGDIDASILSIKKAIQISQENIDFKIQLANKLTNVNKPKEALDLLQSLPQQSDNIIFFLVKSAVLVQAEKWDEAHKLINNKKLQLKDKTGYAWRLLSQIYRSKGLTNKSVAAMKRAGERKSMLWLNQEAAYMMTYSGTWQSLFSNANGLAQRFPKQAENLTTRMLSIDPKNLAALRLASNLALQKKEFKKAMEYSRESVKNPNHESQDLLLLLSSTALESKETKNKSLAKEALKIARDLEDNGVKGISINMYKGESYLVLGNPQKTIESIVTNTRLKEPFSADITVALAAIDLSDTWEAQLPLLRYAHNAAPNNYSIIAGLSIGLCRKNNIKEAKILLKKIPTSNKAPLVQRARELCRSSEG